MPLADGHRFGSAVGDAARPRRSPFGNRHHPFTTSPAPFIYRNPLDILVSKANYYHRDGNAAFSGYLQGRSFEERLPVLIDDPWLFGSIRDRIVGFVPWLAPNVIPVSFEELVGARGGGDDTFHLLREERSEAARRLRPFLWFLARNLARLVLRRGNEARA